MRRVLADGSYTRVSRFDTSNKEKRLSEPTRATSRKSYHGATTPTKPFEVCK